MVTLGLVAVAVVAPGSAYAADSVKLEVCNHYTDTSGDGDINVRISGKNQNGVQTESVSQYVPKNQCKTWYNVYYSYATYDYWWKTDQKVAIWNNRTTSDGTGGFVTHPRTDYRYIPRGVPDGGTQRINLPNQ